MRTYSGGGIEHSSDEEDRAGLDIPDEEDERAVGAEFFDLRYRLLAHHYSRSGGGPLQNVFMLQSAPSFMIPSPFRSMR